MKNIVLAIVVGAVGMLIGGLAAPKPATAGTAAGTGVVGSMHDINKYSLTHAGVQADVEGRVCVFCHTPHHASNDAALDYNPLWSRKTTSVTYTPYKSASFDIATYGGVDPLTGPSRLCMSCHDGITAIDQHTGGDAASDNTTGTFVLTGNMVVNGAASTDHPIGFDYTLAQQARPNSLHAASTTWNGGIGTVAGNLYNGTMMTCATCHEVHNKNNATQDVRTSDGVVPNYLVRSKQTGSALCLTCHNT